MKSFVVNRQGRLVFPSNFLGELDFSVLDTLEQLNAVIGRDFEAKAPTGSEITARIDAGSYPGRFELLRDLGQNLYWVNRYAITMFDKRPTRWRDMPRHRDDVFLPVLTPWEDGERKVAAVEHAYRDLPATWDADLEDKVFGLLFALFRNRRHHATELSPIKPTVAEFLAQPDALTFVLPNYDPDYPVFGFDEIVDADEQVPELEALMRWAMVLHNQYPFDRSSVELRSPAEIGDDDFVVAFHPRNRDVAAFIDRTKTEARAVAHASTTTTVRPTERTQAREPIRPYPPVRVREHFAIQPKLEALAIARGEHICDNDDVIRNASFLLVADERRRDRREDRHPTAPLHQQESRGSRPRGGSGRVETRRAGARRNRGRAGEHLHLEQAHPLGRRVAVRRARARPDPRLGRPGRGLRRPALRSRGGHQAAAGDRPAGVAGVRGEVLGQDRQRPHLADDLR
jgi:hypothetical protein